MNGVMQNISVGKKLLLVIGLASASIVIGIAMFSISMSSIEGKFKLFEEQSFNGVKAVLEAEKELNYFSRLTREIMLGGNLDENLKKLEASHKSVTALLEEVQASSASQREESICAKAKSDALSFTASSLAFMQKLKQEPIETKKIYDYYHTNYSPIAKTSRESMQKIVKEKLEASSRIRAEFRDDIVDWKFYAMTIGILLTIAIVFISVAIFVQIKNSLRVTKDGLFDFFDFLSGAKEKVSLLPELGSDEFGEMSSLINEKIELLETKFVEQQRAILEIEHICNGAKKGFLFYRSQRTYLDPHLNSLVGSFDELLDAMELVFTEYSSLLSQFAQGNYITSSSISRANATGSFASMWQALMSISSSNSEIFALISNFSQELGSDVKTLNKFADELSFSSNEQAASLEETAASLEELASNVRANAQKAGEMTIVAKEAKDASLQGEQMAQESLEAMSEIASATEAINNAVAIIENIAFQTNILSLNAAVEAATAGDAGKGFAVVAQEVRNLANRSADAAKEIQELAKQASQKSKSGLETSKNMMSGFELISTKIAHTDEMVRDVANASHEQMSGIEQINNAVTQLDQMTQQNAKIAESVAFMGGNILRKAVQFDALQSRVHFDEKYKKQSCDASLIFDIAKLKIDHIHLKEHNAHKLKNAQSSWSVTSHRECNLGKWIEANQHQEFAQTKEWETLLQEHEEVHRGVQAFVHECTSANQPKVIDGISQKLEADMSGVFEKLDYLKNINCTISHQGVK